MDNELNACSSCGCLPYVDMGHTEDGVLYRIKCHNKDCPERRTAWSKTYEGAAMRWNSMIGIPHSPKETRKLVEFRPCPDCGCNKYPYLDRRKTYSGMILNSSIVSACCEVCGWETQFHDNIKKCAKEWNEAEV